MVWHIVWDATFTFVALIIISLLLDEAGFFHWAALHIARWGGGTGASPFPAGDPTRRRHRGGVRQRRRGPAADPHRAGHPAAPRLQAGGCAGLHRRLRVRGGFDFSLPLVISNLVNIVSANFFDITFSRYAAVMVPVNLVSLAATLVVLWMFYRRDLPSTYPVSELEAPRNAIKDPLVFKAAFPLLGPAARGLLRDGPVRRSGLGRHLRRRGGPAGAGQPEPRHLDPQGAHGRALADRAVQPRHVPRRLRAQERRPDRLPGPRPRPGSRATDRSSPPSERGSPRPSCPRS